MFGKKTLKPNARMLLALAMTVMASAPICSHADEPALAAVRVKYSASDLSTSEGVHRIYWHIEQAAYAACGESAKDIDVTMRGASPCVRGAIARAVNATKSTFLARVYIEKNGFYVAQQFGVMQDMSVAVRN